MKFSTALLGCCIFTVVVSLNVNDDDILNFIGDQLEHQKCCNPYVIPGLSDALIKIFKRVNNGNDVQKLKYRAMKYRPSIDCFKKSNNSKKYWKIPS